MTSNPDRLYELLPAIHRIRGKEQGEPLRALLAVINEQADLIERDIAQLYDNWFIETCEDWVVPYLAELVGYEPIHEAGEPGEIATQQGRARNKILIPRREVANTVRYRRRKGSLALLELLARDIAGWPARAVEFYKLLGWTQAVNHLHLERGRSVDLRNARALELLGAPFEQLAHTVDVRRINSRHRKGRFNIPSIGVFVWRLRPFSVTDTPAYCVEASNAHRFTFSVLGNDSPLFMKPEPETDPSHIAEEFNLPVPISRRFLARNLDRLYGEGKALCIKRGYKNRPPRLIRADEIVVADLSGWRYLPKRGKVALDPELGRIVFPSYPPVANGVWVSYQYGFSDALGGGEYERSLTEISGAKIYKVGGRQTGNRSSFKRLGDALKQWVNDNPPHAVIEIADSQVYTEQLLIDFSAKPEPGDASQDQTPVESRRESLQLRAANGKRPIIRLLDWQTSAPDALTVIGHQGSRFTLDGLLVTGRGAQLNGDLQKALFRHTTLTPGWEVDHNCNPKRPLEPSLEIFSPHVCVIIEHSILGPIQVNQLPPTPETETEETLDAIGRDELEDGEQGNVKTQAACRGVGADYRYDPIRLCIADSIVDATDPEREAIGAPGCPVAHATVTIERSTVFGQVHAHAIEEGNNSLFMGVIQVARRQIGCLRFSYITPGSRTPRRYHCQPDLAEAAALEQLANLTPGNASPADSEKQRARDNARLRVKPRFNSVHYGTPTYGQLAQACAEEIKRGADDESEMGVFHDLFQPQREANLRVRLDEYIPADADVGIIKVN